MKKNKTKVLGDEGFSRVEFSVVVIVLILFLILAVVILNKNGKSNAGSDNYKNLGSVTWNTHQTAYYANSVFDNYACVTQDTNTKQIRVSGIMIATDYTGYIKSGNYEPGASIRINGDDKTIQSFGNSWQIGNIQNINGAYIKFTTGLLPINTVYQASPLATNYWPSVWTSPVVLKNLSTCNGSNLILPNDAVTTLSSSLSLTSTTLSVVPTKLFPLTVNYYIKVDNEIMLVTSGQSNTTWQVTRGLFNTTITSHDNNSIVQEYLPS
ncbi:MAG TPA: hypothetical protein VII94_03750 [Candidatus Saccharimonadales bacterium]